MRCRIRVPPPARASAMIARKRPMRRRSARSGPTKRRDELVTRIMLAQEGDRCVGPATRGFTGDCGRQPVYTSHIYPKGPHPAMRHVVLNVCPLCYYHHMKWWHLHPIAAHEWATQRLGAGRMARLRLMSLTLNHVDKKAEEIMLRQEAKRLGVL